MHAVHDSSWPGAGQPIGQNAAQGDWATELHAHSFSAKPMNVT